MMTDPYTGERRQRSKTVRAKDGKAADRELHRLIVAAHVDPGRTLEQACRQWLEATAQRKGARTVEEQARVIRLHIRPSPVGQMPVEEVRTHHLEDLYRRLAAGSRPSTKQDLPQPLSREPPGPRPSTSQRASAGNQRPHDRPLSGGTVKHVHDVINTTLRWCQRRGYVPVNVAMMVEELPAVRRRPVSPPDVELVAKVLAEIEAGTDRRFTMLTRLAIVTGARRGELCALQWQDVTDVGRLRLRRSVSEMQRGELIVKEPKTARSVRTVALEPADLEALGRYGEWLRSVGYRTGPTSFLFPAETSSGEIPDRPSRYSGAWGRITRRLGVAIRLHDARHLVASLLIDEGIPVSEVSAQLGHARTSTTQDVYGHLVGDRAAERARIIAERLIPRTQLPDRVT